MPPTADPELLALEDACRGRFAIERELGRGGMGIVVLARDLALDRSVAIKLLPPTLARLPELRERFMREARTAAGLAHPNVVPVHAVEAHGHVVFFVMGFVDGESLARRVARAGPLTPVETARILRDVAWALAYAHGRGVVHRDIKPDNILLDRASGRALVSDFGIARVADAASSLTQQGHVLGTAQYMSPEQAAGEALDGRSDLYALGAVGFFALTGVPPIDAPTIPALLARQLTQPAPPVASRRPGTPAALADAIDRCLAKRPQDRPDSAEQLAEQLAEARGVAAEVPLTVRNFMRLAEQSTLILFIVLVVGLPSADTGGRRAWVNVLAALIAMFAVLLDLGRRARGLLREGYGAGDVVRAFVLEQDAREAEVAALFRGQDHARIARRRRIGMGVAAVLFAAFVLLLLLTRSLPADGAAATGLKVGAAVSLLAAVVTITFLVNDSPMTERRAGALASGLWRSWFTIAFFRVAGLGLGPEHAPRPAATGRDAPSAPPDVPEAVRAHHPELPALLAAGAARLEALREREQRLEAVLAEAGVHEGALVADGAGATTRGELLSRRLQLAAELRGSLDAARAERADLLAAAENVRIQLARTRAGLADATALRPDVDALRRVLDAPAALPVPRPLEAV